jgi:hypothetical protein
MNNLTRQEITKAFERVEHRAIAGLTRAENLEQVKLMQGSLRACDELRKEFGLEPRSSEAIK